jgi:hypothetical protein
VKSSIGKAAIQFRRWPRHDRGARPVRLHLESGYVARANRRERRDQLRFEVDPPEPVDKHGFPVDLCIVAFLILPFFFSGALIRPCEEEFRAIWVNVNYGDAACFLGCGDPIRFSALEWKAVQIEGSRCRAIGEKEKR